MSAVDFISPQREGVSSRENPVSILRKKIMGYTLAIGLVVKQGFERGDVVPTNTAIEGNSCYTLLPCVGKTPTDFKYNDSNGEMDYKFWKEFLQISAGTKRFAKHINQAKSQIIYLDGEEIKEILALIKFDAERMNGNFRERAKWLVFWTEESIKRYGANAAIGLF